jgi:hypothetical protein
MFAGSISDHPTLQKSYEWNVVASDGLCRNAVDAIEERDVELSHVRPEYDIIHI